MTAPTLTEFLLARIADDEAVAREADQEWSRVKTLIGDADEDEADWSFWADYDGAAPSVSAGPARVLAECEAKRMMLELHGPHGRNADELPCRELAVLAIPYADHPDYRNEWRP